MDKDGNELTLMDLLFEKEDCVFEEVERSVQREKLLQQIKKILSEREYTIICLRYALKGGIPLPQREVAKVLKISRSYISRIEKHALEKLRLRLRPEDFLDWAQNKEVNHKQERRSTGVFSMSKAMRRGKQGIDSSTVKC